MMTEGIRAAKYFEWKSYSVRHRVLLPDPSQVGKLCLYIGS